jgi:hypothetical protein
MENKSDKRPVVEQSKSDQPQPTEHVPARRKFAIGVASALGLTALSGGTLLAEGGSIKSKIVERINKELASAPDPQGNCYGKGPLGNMYSKGSCPGSPC